MQWHVLGAETEEFGALPCCGLFSACVVKYVKKCMSFAVLLLSFNFKKYIHTGLCLENDKFMNRDSYANGFNGGAKLNDFIKVTRRFSAFAISSS
jgi:hypothetical protein